MHTYNKTLSPINPSTVACEKRARTQLSIRRVRRAAATNDNRRAARYTMDIRTYIYILSALRMYPVSEPPPLLL